MQFTCFILVACVAAAFGYTDPECSGYNHGDYGCTGQCVSTSSCPGGHYQSNLCPSQGATIKCCFTTQSDAECATYEHSSKGDVGQCMATSDCPLNNYISGLCPNKPADIKCCFNKPLGTCSGGGGGTCGDYTIDGPVNRACMDCICEVESNHDCTIGCRWDVNSDSCGPFQIKDAYYFDAKQYTSRNLKASWKTCTENAANAQECSEQTVQAYMERYATSSRLGRTPTCQDFARIHNGGPNGYKYSSTLGYWDKVNACL